nr:MAG TPA: YopX protein [Caudoviricetes sp.]
MRENIYRGLRKDGRGWAYGSYIYNPRDEEHYIGAYEPPKNPLRGLEWNVYEVDPETVGQFTGLTDQKGNRAFTDSVIRYSGEYGHIAYGVVCFGEIPPVVGVNADHIGFYIEWQNDGANMWNEWWRNDLKYWLAESLCEIIGNRWDNPELLEGAS